MKKNGLWVIAFVIVAIMILTTVNPSSWNRTEIIDESTYYIGDTPLDNPDVGDLWYDTINYEMNIWSGYIWQPLVPTVSGAGYSDHASKHYWGGVDPISFHKLSPEIRVTSEFEDSSSTVGIQEAINDLPNGIGCVLINYNEDKTISSTISIPSNVKLIQMGSGTIKLADDKNIDMIKNSDQTNGNTNIQIINLKLDGNEANQTSGDIFSINFKNVENSEIDAWIISCRNGDVKLDNCNRKVKCNNRYYDEKYTDKIVIHTFDDTTDLTFPGGGSEGTVTTRIEGSKALQIQIPAGGHHYTRYTPTSTLDLKHKFFTIWVKGYSNIANFRYIDLRFYPDKTDTANYTSLGAETSNAAEGLVGTATLDWMKVKLSPATYSIVGTFNDWDWGHIEMIDVHTDAVGEPSAPTIIIDNLVAEPIVYKRPIAILEWDDARSAFYSTALPIMEKYGFKGVQNVYWTKIAGSGKEDLIDLRRQGWEIGSHSVDHPDMTTISDSDVWGQLIRSRYELERLGVGPIRYFAFPGNAYSLSVWQKTKMVYSLCRTTGDLPIGHSHYHMPPEDANLFTTMKPYIDSAMKYHRIVRLGLHDGGGPAFDTLCSYLNELGFDVMTITEYLNTYYPDYPNPDYMSLPYYQTNPLSVTSDLDYFYYEDDFIGDVLRDEWNPTATGTGVAPIVHATGEAGGTIVGSIGATTGGTSTLNFNRVYFKTDLLATIEWRIKISDISEVDAYFGFMKDADEYAYFHIDNGDIYCKTDDGGVDGPFSADSLVNAVDDTYLVFAVELRGDERAKFYINGVLKKTTTEGVTTSDLMDVYFHIVNTSDTDVSLTSDYVRIWQKRI